MPELQAELSQQELWPNAPRASAEDAIERAALAALDAAVSLVQAGNRQGALELCAAIVFQNQPVIGARIELLRRTLHALLMMHGFKLLSRVVTALSGRGILVVLLPEDTEPVAPPRSREEPHRTVYVMDSRWLANLSPEDRFLWRWSDTLSADQRRHPPLVGAAPNQLRLMPV